MTADGASPAKAGRFSLLSGETIRQKLELDDLTITLTDRRAIVAGEERRLWVFPGPTVTRGAFLTDLTVITSASKYLPSWLALAGGGLVLYALIAGLRDTFVVLIIGCVAMAAWYFVKFDILELKVGGETLASVPIRSTQIGAAEEIDRFVDALFAAKATTVPARSPGE